MPETPNPPPSSDEPPASPLGHPPAESLDSPAEVDAVFRTQRRIAVGYAALFALVLVGVSVLTVTLDWWTTGRVLGGMSPGFLTAAVGLYLVFMIVAIAAGSLANAVENRMLGGAADLWQDGSGWGSATADPPAPPDDGQTDR